LCDAAEALTLRPDRGCCAGSARMCRDAISVHTRHGSSSLHHWSRNGAFVTTNLSRWSAGIRADAIRADARSRVGSESVHTLADRDTSHKVCDAVFPPPETVMIMQYSCGAKKL